MSRHDLGKTLPWLVDGTSFLLGAVDGLSDEQLAEPSALPGWTRAHVVAHVARNADALIRLATWARTGEEHLMYPSREARNAEIEESAQLSPTVLRNDLVQTAGMLAEELAALDERSWHAEVRSALGRPIPGLEIPWLRVREVWLHTVDLGAGARFAEFPAEMLDVLLADVASGLSEKDGCPEVTLRTSEGHSIKLGAADQVTVAGTVPDLAAWLTGRSDGAGLDADGGTLPALPGWL